MKVEFGAKLAANDGAVMFFCAFGLKSDVFYGTSHEKVMFFLNSSASLQKQKGDVQAQLAFEW